MARKIDTDAVINSIRLAEQAGDVVAVAPGYWQTYTKEGGLYLEDDNEVVGGPIGTAFEPGGRLTLTTATPVTTADVTAAATVYYTPYKHNMISVYDGARWIPKAFTELSLSLVGYTASKPYDIFAYLNAGAVALESLIWTDGTTRATALAYQNGRLVKSGVATRLYLGTIYINSSGGQTDDSLTKRFVWNYYNRVNRTLRYTDANATWTYATATWRPANNSAAAILQLIVGVSEDDISLSVQDRAITSAVGFCLIGLGKDVTNDANLTHGVINMAAASDLFVVVNYKEIAPLGYHYYSWVEYSKNSSTTTFHGAPHGYLFGVIMM